MDLTVDNQQRLICHKTQPTNQLTINQLPELTTSAAKHNIYIIGIQEHRYYQSEQKIKYHDIGNGWTFLSTSEWKNSANVAIVIPRTLKSLNHVEKIQLRIMRASFNGNPITKIVSRYSSTNSRDKMNILA